MTISLDKMIHYNVLSVKFKNPLTKLNQKSYYSYYEKINWSLILLYLGHLL